MANKNLEILEDLNKSFSNMSQSYVSICSKLGIYNKTIKDDIILRNELMLLQVSMNDLEIQVQNICYKLDALETDITICQNIQLDTNTNNLIDKTIKDMLPLFCLALMNNDDKSILRNNEFNNEFMKSFEEMIVSNSNTSNDSCTNVDDVD